ncbi:hypothetical protein Cus16_0887 [Curtobacterium sp. ER1/6]|nr:hypothetical protein Cus16_0887 [Curtobacterium sp. ER1/6]
MSSVVPPGDHEGRRDAGRTGGAWRTPPRASRPGHPALHLLVRVRVAVPQATALESGDRADLVVGELEAEDVEVLALPVRVAGLRHRDGTELDVPAQDDLARRHPVRGGRVEHRLLGEQFGLLRQRAPALGDDAVLGVHLAELGLREVRVQLDLVHRGRDTGGVDDRLQVLGREVRDADRADLAAVPEVHEGLPRVDEPAHRRVRPVDEVQVDAVQPEVAERLVDRAVRLVVAVVATGQLRGDDEVLAVDLGLADGTADGVLVAVVERGVEQPVAARDRRTDGSGTLVAVQPVGAEAELGEPVAVVQLDGGRADLHQRTPSRSMMKMRVLPDRKCPPPAGP